MKKIFLFCTAILISFLSVNTVFANYSTPGSSVSWNLNDLVSNSGGVVTFSSGTYFVNDTLTVSSTDTLKILTNSTVKLAYNVVFLVNGTIIVNPSDSVKFSSIDTTQKFYELRLDGAGINSSFNKFIFEYSMNGMRLLNVSPQFTNCTFRYNCFGATLTTPALNLFNSNAVVTNCLFYRNYRAAIAGGSNIANAPQITNSQFIENVLTSGNVPQINLGQSGAGTTVIRGCTIIGISVLSGGIAALPTGTLTLIAENNLIKKNRYGIALNGSVNAIIRGNTIDSNNIQGLPLSGGSGLNFVGSGVNARVSKNIIRWNLWGVTLQSNAAPVFGDLSISDTNYIGMNQIHSNSNSGVFYDFYNNTPQPIKAENNFWGTMILDSVEAHIFHHPDIDSLGVVDYLPLWTPVGISPVNTEMPSQYRLMDAYPNPFNPETNIRFEIPAAGDVKISVFDITGKEVSLLLNSYVNAGKYELKFNAGNFSSGVYFYTLISGSYSSTKKLVLIK
ncbi:MAG: T9SS type A sorting domain-containing protein [Ignavibacteria bacterium]|nr:T9SS type A sorting domain-containing protein [Ignavibacteria bacterium]